MGYQKYKLSSRGSSLYAAGSDTEGTCNLTLGETLPPLSTGTNKINTKRKVLQSCFKEKSTATSLTETNVPVTQDLHQTLLCYSRQVSIQM